jgi:hypothetical protein
MKTEFRRDLAQLPFEEKVHKIGELIRLSRELKAQRIREDARTYSQSGWNLAAALGELPPKNSKK